MSARRLDHILKPLLAECAKYFDFQGFLNDLESDAERKEEIMIAYMGGLLDDDACGLLITAYGLEEA